MCAKWFTLYIYDITVVTFILHIHYMCIFYALNPGAEKGEVGDLFDNIWTFPGVLATKCTTVLSREQHRFVIGLSWQLTSTKSTGSGV